MIYLKSPMEKATAGESSSSRHSEETSGTLPFSSPRFIGPKTFSSQVFFEQARADLKHPDPKIRILAIQYLEKSDPSIAIPLLQEVLTDTVPSVRAQALSSLINVHDPVVASLLKKYLKDRDPQVKIAALRGMFLFKEKLDLNILLQLLSDESPWVRRKVATLLGWTQMEGTLPILTEMSKDEDSGVRKAALLSLITLYPHEGENRLLEAMTDSDPSLRKWARDALEKRLARPLRQSSARIQSDLRKN